MHPVLEGIRVRPTSHKVAMWAASLLVSFGLFYQYSYKGLSAEVAKLREEREGLDTQILNEQRTARDFKRVKELVEKLEVKLKEALAQLPDKEEIPTLLTAISGLAKDAGLEVQLFKPQGEVIREFFAEVPVSIQVVGSYHKVGTFFDEVAKLARIVNMGQLSMVEPKVDEGEVKLTTTCVATTFRYLDESERVKPDSTAAGKRRPKK